VHDDALATHLHLLGGSGDLGVGHPGGVRIGTRHKVVARQVDLDAVDTVLQKHAHDFAHVVCAIDVNAKAVLRERQVRQRFVAQAARHGDLLAGGQVAWAGDLAAVDGIADHHVEPGLGASRTEATGETCLKVALGHLRTPQHMLLQRHRLNA
jgi:hypothetical protein